MRDGPSPSAERLVVFDFDGTVAIGDEPVLAYLDAILERVPSADGSHRAELDAFLASGGEAADGYALVVASTRAAGVPDRVRQDSYAASRLALHDGRVAVDAPPGLAALLDRRPAGVVCALVTNAPVDGIEPVLDRLGLGARFDRVVGDARKPAGMRAALRALLDESGLRADRLLSVGDVWQNDLAPAAALGAATAYVDRFGRGDGDPTFRAPDLPGLMADIEGWWAT